MREQSSAPKFERDENLIAEGDILYIEFRPASLHQGYVCGYWRTEEVPESDSHLSQALAGFGRALADYSMQTRSCDMTHVRVRRGSSWRRV